MTSLPHQIEPGIELGSPALQADSLLAGLPGKPFFRLGSVYLFIISLSPWGFIIFCISVSKDGAGDKVRETGFGLESSDSWLGGREVEDWRSSNPTPAQGKRAFHRVLGMLKHAVLWFRPEHPHRDIAACRLRANLWNLTPWVLPGLHLLVAVWPGYPQGLTWLISKMSNNNIRGLLG